MNGSMDTVWDCVIPYIHNGDDLNSISLVCRKGYELDCITRKHVTVHVHYASHPSRLSQRFPYIESLTFKGFPGGYYRRKEPGTQITPWIQEIAIKFKCLKEICIRDMIVSDSDLELLVRKRGKDLRSLKMYHCQGFSMDGLMHVSMYCYDLRTLWLEGNFIKVEKEKGGKWLYQLALHNKVIESLHFDFEINDVKFLTLFAKTCSNSLVSLKTFSFNLSDLGEAISHAIKLEYFGGAKCDEDEDYSNFKFPQNIRGLCFDNLPRYLIPFLYPYVDQLRELDLSCIDMEGYCHCFLIERCRNLEVLRTNDECGDIGLGVVGQFCKKLRKLTHDGYVTHMGLIALAQGCPNLENLDVTLLDISNEAIECVGTHLKNLRDFHLDLVKKDGIADLPLDNGIRAMLMGCSKLESLDIRLCPGGLTDMGLEYIGKYGHNIKYLSLECVGESDAGFIKLSNGCSKLRELVMNDCPFSEQAIAAFVFNIHSLRYISAVIGYDVSLALTRPTVTEVQK